MRGSFTYDDLVFKITKEDREILNKIIKDNIEATKDSGMPIL
tara:strand:- start:839 stop:964 length:126 start_codon:yes stop_codon:yes gene_type:complete